MGKYANRLLLAATILTACNNSTNSRSAEKNARQLLSTEDSLELTRLVRSVYQWHVTKHPDEFPLKFNTPSDSIYTGIDWDSYVKTIEAFNKTSFFSNDFMAIHRKIALGVDSAIKASKPEMLNINDGIPFFETGGDDWCECQDYPDNYWKIITLNDFNFTGETVTFNWTWGNVNGVQANKYEIKARKERNAWKINSIDGFKHHLTAEEYDKINE